MIRSARKEWERQARKEEIIKAAAKIFSEKGYHQATLEDIAKEAEYSKAALYLYFKNKEDLFCTTFEKGIEGIVHEMKEAAYKPDTLLTIFDVVETLLNFFEQNRAFNFLTIRQTSWRKTINDRIEKTSQLFISFFTYLVFVWQNQGILKKDHCAADLTHLLFGMITGIVLAWIKSDYTTALSDKKDIIVDAFLKGAGNK